MYRPCGASRIGSLHVSAANEARPVQALAFKNCPYTTPPVQKCSISKT